MFGQPEFCCLSFAASRRRCPQLPHQSWRSIQTNPEDTTSNKSTAGRVAQQHRHHLLLPLPPLFSPSRSTSFSLSLTNGLLCGTHKGFVMTATGEVPAAADCRCWRQSASSSSDGLTERNKKVLHGWRKIILLRGGDTSGDNQGDQ